MNERKTYRTKQHNTYVTTSITKELHTERTTTNKTRQAPTHIKNERAKERTYERKEYKTKPNHT